MVVTETVIDTPAADERTNTAVENGITTAMRMMIRAANEGISLPWQHWFVGWVPSIFQHLFSRLHGKENSNYLTFSPLHSFFVAGKLFLCQTARPWISSWQSVSAPWAFYLRQFLVSAISSLQHIKGIFNTESTEHRLPANFHTGSQGETIGVLGLILVSVSKDPFFLFGECCK